MANRPPSNPQGPQDRKSPSLADVSDLEGAENDRGEERRRVPRLNLTTEQFRLAQNGKIFSVADLSANGMALRVLDRSDLALFPVGMKLDGTINLRREKYAISARVRHIGTDLVGCEFETLDGAAKKALTSFLDPEALGQELMALPSAEGGALWYHGPSGTDLLFWPRADGQYSKFALFLLGSYVQWEDGRGVSTGRVSSAFEPSDVRGVMRFETMLLDADHAPDAGKLAVAKTLILSSNLPQELKKWCGQQLAVHS